MKKKLKRIFLYFLLTVGVLATVPPVAIFFLRDDIIQHFIREANKRIDTPVKVKKVDIAIWKSFPNISILFHDIYVEDSYAEKTPLLTATSISVHIDPILLWKGQYSILGLAIHQGRITLKVNRDGVYNYIVLKKINADKDFINFNLKNIKLIETTFSYLNQQKNQYHLFSSSTLRASIDVSDWYDIAARGSVTIDQIGVPSMSLLNGKKFNVETALRYHRKSGKLFIKPSTIKFQKSRFEVQGRYGSNFINLTCNGKNTTINTLLSLLPKKATKRIKRYKSDGDMYFNFALKGKLDADHDPSLSLQLGLKNATLSHTEYPSKIKNITLKGNFFSPSISNLSSASLTINNIAGTLNGNPFEGEVMIKNFDDPYVKFNMKGGLGASFITNFYAIDQLSDVSGSMQIDIHFAGRIGLLKNTANMHRISARGALMIQDLGFAYKNTPPLKHVNGVVRFDNSDFKLESIRGELQNTDFEVNGALNNMVAFLFLKNRPVGVDATITSNFIDMDQLTNNFIKEDSTHNRAFGIPKNIYLNINYDVGALRYKRFKLKQLTGNLLIKNQTGVLRNVAFQSMGGDFSFNGILDAQQDSTIDFIGTCRLSGMKVDSIFYVFNNFQQDFIRSEHLRGDVFADMDMEVSLTKKLKPLSKTFFANVNATLKKGELNQFTPLKKLNKYIPKKELNHLKFADIKNNIMIKNKTVYIPLMKLRSNASTIQVSGSHGFDKRIDYHLIVPLRLKKKADKDEAFGSLEKNSTETTKLFLRIHGTTDRYKVSYEKKAVKQKIMNDLKKEMTELQDIFRKKDKQQKNLKVEKEDYFDWNDTIPNHNR